MFFALGIPSYFFPPLAPLTYLHTSKMRAPEPHADVNRRRGGPLLRLGRRLGGHNGALSVRAAVSALVNPFRGRTHTIDHCNESGQWTHAILKTEAHVLFGYCSCVCVVETFRGQKVHSRTAARWAHALLLATLEPQLRNHFSARPHGVAVPLSIGRLEHSSSPRGECAPNR